MATGVSPSTMAKLSSNLAVIVDKVRQKAPDIYATAQNFYSSSVAGGGANAGNLALAAANKNEAKKVAEALVKAGATPADMSALHHALSNTELEEWVRSLATLQMGVLDAALRGPSIIERNGLNPSAQAVIQTSNFNVLLAADAVRATTIDEARQRIAAIRAVMESDFETAAQTVASGSIADLRQVVQAARR